MDPRDAWLAALKPGDEVCTCTNEHKTISRVKSYEEPRGAWALLGWIAGMFDPRAGLMAQNAVGKVSGTEVVQRTFFFPDGTHCKNECLDPIGPGCLHD